MRVLVAYATKRGGTTGIAKALAGRLRDRGIDTDALPADRATNLGSYDAFVVGSALYNGRWQRPAVRLLKKLSKIHPHPRVWLFHSGPLGDDANEPQALPKNVANLASMVEGGRVETFGGRLEAEPKGLIARAMARNGMAGDWRDMEQIHAAGDAIADALLESRAPGRPNDSG